MPPNGGERCHSLNLAVIWKDWLRTSESGDAMATYPIFETGWPAFDLNPTQHQISLRRMAELDADVLAVGHGDPITAGAGERVRSLVEGR